MPRRVLGCCPALSCRPGLWEFQLESAYLHRIYAGGGCRTAHYTPIFASGPNAAVLHYGHTNAPNGGAAGRIL